MTRPMTNRQPGLHIDAALQASQHNTGLPLSELRILMSHVTGLNRVGLITHNTMLLSADQFSQFESLVKRRVLGEPVAYLTGVREFFSREFMVTPDVLIPRPETEELVEKALQWLEKRSRENLLTKVLDMGCGSGAIGLTLALENPILEVTLSDVSEAALQVAQANAKKLAAKNVQCVHSNLFEAFSPEGQPQQFDLIVSNPPYIASGDEHLQQGDLRFEPLSALTDHQDGLFFYRQLAQHAAQHLRPTGAVLVEHGYTQQGDVLALFRQAGFAAVGGFTDLAGQPRMVLALQ